jgi:S-adenosylmethionine decarboxylase proenzyme
MSESDWPVKLGTHYLVDFSSCGELPDDEQTLVEILMEGVRRSGATIVQTCAHRFSPHGLSAVIVIAESHLAAHTWPEFGAMCIDLFSCSESIDAAAAITYIQAAIKAGNANQRIEDRMVFGKPAKELE